MSRNLSCHRSLLAGFFLLSFLAFMPAPRADGVPTLLPSAGLQANVDILEQAFSRLHPGLYRYNTPEQMTAHFRELRASLVHDQSLSDVWVAFSLFARTLRCGHTYTNFYNQSDAVAQALLQLPNRVPLLFRWIDRRMVVSRNLPEDASLIAGTTIMGDATLGRVLNE